MNKITWKDEYCVGVEKIDQQHQHLFELVVTSDEYEDAKRRLSAGNLDDAGLQFLHIAAIVGRLQIARLVAGSTVVAMLAIAATRVRHLKRDDDGAAGWPVK